MKTINYCPSEIEYAENVYDVKHLIENKKSDIKYRETSEYKANMILRHLISEINNDHKIESCKFAVTDWNKEIVKEVIEKLKAKGFSVKTKDCKPDSYCSSARKQMIISGW